MRRLTIACLVLLPVLVGAAARAQSPEEVARGGLGGRVLAPDGSPIGAALVKLLPAVGPGAEREVMSRANGDWRLTGLRPGIWQIEIHAEGYQTARGKIDLRSPQGALQTTLEVDADVVVRDWLEEANVLLAAGSAAQAQELYERALSVVPLPQSPPVHSALARAHYLQGRVDEAVKSLQRAVLTQPNDEQARQLLAAVLDSADRAVEAIAWLALLDEKGVAAAGAAAFGVEVDEKPLNDAPKGRFRTVIDRPSEEGGAERLLAALGSWERLGVAGDAPWSPAADSFELYVPQTQRQGGYGLVVWISPTPRGGLPDPAMTEVLDQHSTLWIGANGAGNARPRADRMRLALDAVRAAKEAYSIDPARVYVAGYSGGGRMASTLAIHFPDVFTGGIYFMGVDFYRHVPKADQPGTSWGAVLRPPSSWAEALLKRRSRFVFITGAHDFNRAQTHAYRDEYVVDGLDRVTLIEIPDAGHYYGFKASELAAAIVALDEAPEPAK